MDPYTQAVAASIQAVAGAVRAEAELDLYLAQHDEDYRAAVIEERLAAKEFWEPLRDLLMKIGEGLGTE